MPGCEHKHRSFLEMSRKSMRFQIVHGMGSGWGFYIGCAEYF